MRKFAFLLAVVLLTPTGALADQGAPVTVATGTLPVSGGPCVEGPTGRVQVEESTGTLWCCVGGFWDDCGTGYVDAHEAAADPHPFYLTQAEGDGRYLQSYTETDPTIPASCSTGQPIEWNGSAFACGTDDTGGGVTVPATTRLLKGNGAGGITYYYGASCSSGSYVTSIGSTGTVSCGTPSGGGGSTEEILFRWAGQTTQAILGSPVAIETDAGAAGRYGAFLVPASPTNSVFLFGDAGEVDRLLRVEYSVSGIYKGGEWAVLQTWLEVDGGGGWVPAPGSLAYASFNTGAYALGGEGVPSEGYGATAFGHTLVPSMGDDVFIRVMAVLPQSDGGAVEVQEASVKVRTESL